MSYSSKEIKDTISMVKTQLSNDNDNYLIDILEEIIVNLKYDLDNANEKIVELQYDIDDLNETIENLNENDY